MLPAAANALVRVLLAPVCAACRRPLSRPLEGAVCAACWLEVPRLTPPLCPLCGDAMPPVPEAGPRTCSRCQSAPPGFAASRSAGAYAGSLRALIHAFKYDRVRTLAGPLASLVRDAGADFLAEADAIVPVPMHPWRALHRGFNHADDLALQLGLPVLRVLRRARHGPPQATLAGGQRHANVAGAFRPRSGLPFCHRRSPIRHLHLLLIDDVMTTGATLDACSRVLLEEGAASVRAVTVARALAPPPQRLPHSRHPSTVRRR